MIEVHRAPAPPTSPSRAGGEGSILASAHLIGITFRPHGGALNLRLYVGVYAPVQGVFCAGLKAFFCVSCEPC